MTPLSDREKQMLEALKGARKRFKVLPDSISSIRQDCDAIDAAIAACEPRKCGVGWKDPYKACGNPATHRAVSTSGKETTVFHVCEECAMLGAALKYKDFMGDSQMLPGDPLWLIWPPLDAAQPTHGFPDPHVFDHTMMDGRVCKHCMYTEDSAVHIKPKHRWVVEFEGTMSRLALPGEFEAKGKVIREVKPITREDRIKALAHWRGADDERSLHRVLAHLGIDVED